MVNDLEIGDHRLVIGEVLEAYAKAKALEERRPAGTESSMAAASHRRKPLHRHEGRDRGTAAS